MFLKALSTPTCVEISRTAHYGAKALLLTGTASQRNGRRYDIYLTAKDTHLNAMSSVQRVDLFTNNSLGTSARTAPVFYAGFPGATIYGNTYVFVNIKVRTHPHPTPWMRGG